MKYLGNVFLFCLLCVVGVTVFGYTISTLWEWFIVDTFGVQKITLLQGYGLTLIASVFQIGQHIELAVIKEFVAGKNKKPWYHSSCTGVMVCLSLLFFGYIIKSLM